MGTDCRFTAMKIAVRVMLVLAGLTVLPATRVIAQSASSSPVQELLAPGSELTSATYGLLFEAHLHDLEESSDFYRRVMAATTISVPERRLGFDEFFAWWAVEMAQAKSEQTGPLFTRHLWAQYLHEKRLASLSKPERRRAEYVGMMLSSFHGATYYALERLKNDEAIQNPSYRLQQFVTVMKALASDERCLQAAAAMAILFYDLSQSDLVQGQEKTQLYQASLQMLRDARDAAERAGQIDILAPHNLVGGLGLVKILGPMLNRNSTFRFLRYTWSRSTAFQKTGAVADVAVSIAATGAGMSALASLQKSHRGKTYSVSSEAEWVLVGQVVKIANGDK